MTNAIDGNSFFSTVKSALHSAGQKVVAEAYKAWLTAQHPDTPPRIKAVLYSALAYLALPVDAIPDVVPIVGFSDDLAVLAGALLVAQVHATDEIHAEAYAKAARLFE